MAIKLDKDKFKEVDSAFVDILENKNKSAATSKIESILSSVFDKKFKVNIMKPKPNTPMYVMSIFPEQSTIEKLVDSIVNEKPDKELKDIWDDNGTWTIEIDNRILTGSFVDANSKELTALILHECGHVIYSNSIPQRMSKVMKHAYAKANLGTKSILKKDLFKRILELPILKACIFENYKSDAGLQKELKADVFAVKMGYGEELRSVLMKILATSSPNKKTAGHIDQDSGKVYDRMRADTDYSINLIEDLKKREAKLSRANFSKMLLSTPSEFILNSLKGLESKLFTFKFTKNDSGELEKDHVVEESVLNYIERLNYEPFNEGLQLFKKKMTRIDPSMIDYVVIRKSDMKTNDDKLMLSSYIHSKLDLINYYLLLMEDPKLRNKYIFTNTQSELLGYKKMLERAKDEILNYKIPDVHYGIRIMYPDGYTG